MTQPRSSHKVAVLAASILMMASGGFAFAQTAPAASPSSAPVNVIDGPLPAVATPSPQQKAAILKTKNKQAPTKNDKLKQGYVMQSGLNSTTSAPSASGSNCIQTQVPQATQQMHANTGEPAQTVVDVPVDDSASVAAASSRDRLAQACATH